MDEIIFKNLSDMLNNSSNTDKSKDSRNINTSEILKNMIFNFNSNNNKDDDLKNKNNGFDFSNIDIETIAKISKIMGKIGSNTSNPRSNLLLSLKPYLKPSKRDKIDQYIKFINITSIMEDLNKTGGDI